ncbi:MAG: ArgK/MeaB family GTPase [Pirellulales bacterium]
MSDSTSAILEGFVRRDRRALAKVLSLVEGHGAPPPPDGQPVRTRVVGITGSGGAGKSTLVGSLVRHVRSLGLSVAVLACDPQSPLTGGALLGDRIRVLFDPRDEQVYFRSLSTRGAPGGISAAVGPAIQWLRRFGFDVILVETVGVGQDQIAVRQFVETLVLVVTPNSGDEIQWEKAGLIEVVDLVAVNKSDLPGADRVAGQLAAALSLDGDSRQPPVLKVAALAGRGVAELWAAIAASRGQAWP